MKAHLSQPLSVKEGKELTEGHTSQSDSAVTHRSIQVKCSCREETGLHVLDGPEVRAALHYGPEANLLKLFSAFVGRMNSLLMSLGKWKLYS